MKLKCLVLFISLILFRPVKCQEVSSEIREDYKKNLIYGTAGFVFVYGTAIINYERILAESPRFFSILGARFGTGRWLYWDDEGFNYFATLQAATGHKKGHFEIGGGFALTDISHSSRSLFLPCGNIGYRFQKPGGNFVLKTGVGWPESVYFSAGVSF